MHTFEWIQLVVLACAVAMLILSFLMMGRPISTGRVAPQSFFDSGFGAFILAIAVIVGDAALWLAIYLWGMPTGGTAVLLGGFGLVAVCGIGSRRIRAGALNLWGKFRGAAPSAPAKRPWLSKTIILNAIVAAGLLAEHNISSLQGLLPPGKYEAVAFGIPIVNMLLRMYTNQGVSFAPAAPTEEVSQ
jgi:hypothetical protein